MKLIPTPRWLAIAAGLALIAPLAVVWPAALDTLLLLDAAWLVALVIDAAVLTSGSDLGNFEVERAAPLALGVGRATPVSYRWKHGGRRRVTVLVRERLPEALGTSVSPVRCVALRPGEVTLEQLEVTPATRGHAGGGALTVRAPGRLGLAWRQTRLDLPWDATVYPAVISGSLRALPAVARRREAGLRNVRQLGAGRLFESLREWVPGDDTRIIDWKATARRGKPIARQYEDERRQQVLIMLDAGRLLTAESDGISRLEFAVTASLRLAAAAVEHDDDVGVLVFADTIQRYSAPARGRRAMRAVLEALALAHGRIVESDYPTAFRHVAVRNRKRALTVLFTDVVDRTASDALVSHAATLRPRHLPLAVTLRDPALERIATAAPATLTEAFERAAAEELLLAREEALAVMRAQGVLVLDVAPRSAAEAVVEKYHQLKRRGML
ncbi:MAG: DUF58 domain-containing protein [Gemmatimonadales bacterium]|nr:DUF58 domain-containing protein [Gemmatimonadales bacterium]